MVRVWLSVNLKRHGIDCGGTVGRIGPWTRADRSQTWPHLGHNLDTGANPFNVVRGARGKSLGFSGSSAGASEQFNPGRMLSVFLAAHDVGRKAR
jgi:hypothetical protein